MRFPRLDTLKAESIEAVSLKKLIDLAKSADSLQEAKLRHCTDMTDVRRRFQPLAAQGFRMPLKSALDLTEKVAQDLLASKNWQQWLRLVDVWTTQSDTVAAENP